MDLFSLLGFLRIITNVKVGKLSYKHFTYSPDTGCNIG